MFVLSPFILKVFSKVLLAIADFPLCYKASVCPSFQPRVIASLILCRGVTGVGK